MPNAAMRSADRRRAWLGLLTGGLVVGAGCAGGPGRPAPAPSSGPTAAAPTAPAAPGQAPAPRRAPPNPTLQDSVRRATVDSILATIAGREQEPAGAVFKNVKHLRDVPAREFLRLMDEQYGRGLGMVCANCHAPGGFDSDERKNKRIAREMQAMTARTNAQLTRVANLDADFDKASCVMCHRGNAHAKGTMPVPPVPVAPADSAAIAGVLVRMFDGMRAKDTAMVASTLHEQVRFTLLRPAGDSVRAVVLTGQQFLQGIGSPASPPTDEPIRNVRVTVDGPLATAWAEYQVRADGRVANCGYDAFQLTRTSGGWKVLSVADSYRRTGCGTVWP